MKLVVTPELLKKAIESLRAEIRDYSNRQQEERKSFCEAAQVYGSELAGEPHNESFYIRKICEAQVLVLTFLKIKRRELSFSEIEKGEARLRQLDEERRRLAGRINELKKAHEYILIQGLHTRP